MKSRHVLAAYSVLFLGLFLPLAWRGELPGNVDTVLGIALSNLLKETVGLFLGGQSAQTVLYPASTFIPYGENCFGLGIIYSALRIVTPNDVWAHALFSALLFTASGFGVFKLASLFVGDRRTAFVAGVVFTLSSFILANVDDLNVVCVFFPAMALYEIERGFREKNVARLRLGLLLSAAQVWFGFYLFVIHVMALALYFLLNSHRWSEWRSKRNWASLATAAVLPALPILALYLTYHFTVPSESPFPDYNVNLRRVLSLDFHHFRNVLPGNLLYPSESNVYQAVDASIPSRLRKTAFPGFLFIALTLFGAYKARTKHLWLIVIGVAFLLLSFGSNLPGFVLVSNLPLGDYFRSPLRFHVESTMMFAILFAIGLDAVVAKKWLQRRAKWASGAAVAAAGLVFALENVPVPLPGFEFASLLEPPPSYAPYFSKFDDRKVVLDLPTSLGFVVVDGSKVFGYNREMLYMNWQTFHRQKIAGGLNAYMPPDRNRIDRFSASIPGPDTLKALREMKVEYLVFHKTLVLSPREDRLADFKKSDELELVHEDAALAIFRQAL